METKTRILIADANTDFCKLLNDVIAAEPDMETAGIAGDGIEALAMAAELLPDVVLMDLVLPKLDGLEVLRRFPETAPGATSWCCPAFSTPRLSPTAPRWARPISCPSPATPPP